jgi:hypothetical protein
MVVPHVVAAAVSGKYGCKRSGQGDFVKLSSGTKVSNWAEYDAGLRARGSPS